MGALQVVVYVAVGGGFFLLAFMTWRAPRPSRRRVVLDGVGYVYLGAAWLVLFAGMALGWGNADPSIVWWLMVALWSAACGAQVVIVMRMLRWLDERSEPKRVLAEGEPGTGTLVAVRAQVQPWIASRMKAVPIELEVFVDGSDEAVHLQRWRAADPQARPYELEPGSRLCLKVLEDELAIDWPATRAATPAAEVASA